MATKNSELNNISYQKANAADMPFPNGHFDFVVATMSFMDIAELEKVLTEINRVLTTDGFLQFSIVHPCFNEHKGQWVEDERGNITGFLMKDYFVETTGDIHTWQHEQSPPDMPQFETPRFWRPLSTWLTLVANAGFSIEEVCEPYPDEEALKKHPELARSRIVAHSIIVRARKDKQNKNVLRKIIENLPGNAWWKDKNLVYQGCNDRVIQVLGLTSRKEFIGKTDDELWEPTIAEKLKEADLYVLKTGETINLEETIIESNGRHAIMLTNKSPFYDEQGNIIGIVGTSTDITERKQQEKELKEAKERAEAANKAKSEFLENMRHDIRTPLTGIVGFANILKDEADNPQIKEYADNLVASSNALQEFLNEILEAIRVASGEIPQLKNKFDLKKRLIDIVNLNQAKAKQKKLLLQLDYDNNIPAYLIGDAKRIQRIALELVTNALNFTDKGSVNISVQLAKKEQRNVIIKIIVTDTGIGIATDKQQEIFTRFKRLTPSYEGIYKGAGLGLTVIKQFIDDLEGEIYVDSKPKKGSTFTCIIPLKEALLDENFGTEIIEEPQAAYTTTIQTAPTITNKLTKTTKNISHILLVEDQAIAAKMATHILAGLDCQIDHAADGQTAISYARQNHYDLIFMDVGLPDISGMEVTKRIRLQDWNQDTPTPIIALTAHVDGQDKQLCIESGMNAVLSKPLTKEIANDILNAFIPHRSKSATISSTTPLTPTSAELTLSLSGPTIDFAAGLRLTNNNPELLKEMIEMLINSFPEELTKLAQAKQQKDWEPIRAIAHKLKGGASYCSANRLKEAATRLENYLRQEDRDLAEILYQQLIDEIKLLRKLEINKLGE